MKALQQQCGQFERREHLTAMHTVTPLQLSTRK
jgi:hypothetical protein